MTNRKQLVAYMPVLHAGYLQLIERHADAHVLVLGTSFAELVPPLAKEIRALDPHLLTVGLRALYPARQVHLAELTDIANQLTADHIIMPAEDISRAIVEHLGLPAERVTYDQTFLRWDRDRSRDPMPISPSLKVSAEQLHRRFIGLAQDQAERSSDWWRQVGGVVVKDDLVLLADHNRHVPHEYAPYFNGDPRGNFKRGTHIELSTAIHAEAALIARAAREGISLEGASIFTTTFPCPPCAHLIAEAGLAACYFADPYAMLDGEDVMRAAGVQLVLVEM